jgi:hypothetical protein
MVARAPRGDGAIGHGGNLTGGVLRSTTGGRGLVCDHRGVARAAAATGDCIVRTKQQRVKDGVRLVLLLLNDLDPYGLSPGDMAPWDAYELEATPMVRLLLANEGIAASEVDAIWEEWFEERLSDAISAAAFRRFVDSLNELELPSA